MARVPADKRIAEAFCDWLIEEVESSGQDSNKFLDNLAENRRRLVLGYDNNDNWPVNKHKSHMDRFPIWWEAYALDPLDDQQSAKILFNALMQVSGTYRDQCLLQAQNQEDYLEKRSKAIGIDPVVPVDASLRVLVPGFRDFATADIDVEALDDKRLRAMRLGEHAIKLMCTRLGLGYDLGERDSESVRQMRSAQYEWLSFATDCVTLAAKLRGGELSAVPFLEAKSIKYDPQVIYPLAA